MIKRILLIVLVVVIGIAVVNDVGRYVVTYYNLSETTRQAARAAARTSGDRNDIALAAVDAAEANGITVYAFDMDGSRVYVYTEVPLKGTWVLGPVLLSVQGGGLTGDYMLRSEQSALRE